MASVCLYMHAHQPFRMRNYSVFDIGSRHDYFDADRNKHYLERIAQKSYLPTNAILYELIRNTNGRFKVSFSITGVLLDQLAKYCPEVIESFQKIVNTGCCELVSETYYHSLAYLFSENEFKTQVDLHKKKLKKVFNYTPKIFRNTELTYNTQMAQVVKDMGYKAILAEGADHILDWRSPNFIYQSPGKQNIKLLLRNYRLSDDIAFRFSEKSWSQWPLTTEKFVSWANAVNGNGEIINLFMDYETFGEHQWEDSGIFEFLKAFPFRILEHADNNFQTPSEMLKLYKAKAELDFPHIVSWADVERDLSAWLGNKMQQSAARSLYELEDRVKASKDEDIMEDWRRLQTSDHLYYMCTKWFSDGDVHKYFNPYESPYEAYITFMNIINDLKMRLA